MPGDSRKIFLVAGEASGDLLGASLMEGLRAVEPGVRFCGVGGARMEEQGMQSLFPMEELSVMGVAEVLPRLRNILKRIDETARAVEREQPDAVVTIDSPDFCFRVIAKLKSRGVNAPCIHYVAPSVWAWRPGRAKKVAKFLDHLLALLPFEPPYFEKEGLGCTFVGHPVVESFADTGDGAAFRKRHGIDAGRKLLCMLPGSRRSELAHLLPIFTVAAQLLKKKHPDLAVAVPTLPHLVPTLEQAFDGIDIAPLVVTGVKERNDCFAAADVALAASGTVALELAMQGTPAVIGYRVSPLTGLIGRMLIKTPYASLVNIIEGREVTREFIQQNCTPEKLYTELDSLISDTARAAEQRAAYRLALEKLGLGNPESPGMKAAKAVLEVIEKNRGKQAKAVVS